MTSTVANEHVVTLDRVSKRFKSVVALDGLTLTVERGATLGLLGLNGAGKTTTMKLLLGLLHPDFGEINMLGVDPAVDPVSVKQRGRSARRRSSQLGLALLWGPLIC